MDRRQFLIGALGIPAGGGISGKVALAAEDVPSPEHMRLRMTQAFAGHTAPVGTAVTFSPDGSFLASAAEDRTVRVWPLRPDARVPSPRVLPGHADFAGTSVAFSPRDPLLAAPGADGKLRLWNTRTWELAGTLPVAGLSLVFSPDGSLLATTGQRDTEINLWDVSRRSLAQTLRAEGRVEAIRFSPDGRHVTAGGREGLIQVWRLRDGEPVQRLEWHLAPIRTLAYAPDGRWLASGGEDRVVRIWTRRGKLARTLGPLPHLVGSLAFRPDGKALVAGTMRELHVWRVSDGMPLGVVDAHADWINALSFSPDGAYLATGSRDRTVKLWQVG